MMPDEKTSRYGENSGKTVAHLKEKLKKKKKNKHNDGGSEVVNDAKEVEEIETRKKKKKKRKQKLEIVKTGHGSKEEDKNEVESDEETETEKKMKHEIRFGPGTKGEEEDDSSTTRSSSNSYISSSSSNGEIETPKENKKIRESKLGDDNGIVKSDKTDKNPSSSQHKKDEKKEKKLTSDEPHEQKEKKKKTDKFKNRLQTVENVSESVNEITVKDEEVAAGCSGIKKKKEKSKTTKLKKDRSERDKISDLSKSMHVKSDAENVSENENEITVKYEEVAAGCSGIKKKKEKSKTTKLKKDGSERDKISDLSKSMHVKSDDIVKKQKKKKKQTTENQEMEGKSPEGKIKRTKKDKDVVVVVSELEDTTADQHSETDTGINRDNNNNADKLETEQEESKKKKRKKRKSRDNENMNNQEDEVQVKRNKIDEAGQNQEADEKKKKKKRKLNEHEEADNEIRNTPRKIKVNDMEQKSESCSTEIPIVSKPFQPISKEIWKNPVCESEERQRKFQRLLGGNKSSNKKPSFQSRLSVSENTKEEGIDSHNGVSSEEKGSSPVLGAGQWKGTMFENAERQNKFLRLLGGAKSQGDKKKTLFSSNSSGPKKGLFGSLASNSSGVSKALDLQSAASLNQRLEEDFNQALNKRIGGMGAAGIGFVKDPAEGKKFHIDINASKSVKFSDDE